MRNFKPRKTRKEEPAEAGTPNARGAVAFVGSRILLLLLMMFLGSSAPAQVYRIAATITITNEPTTNAMFLTVNGDTRIWTNNPALNPAVWIQTNLTKNGSATNLFLHVSQYRFASSINTTWANTNAVKLQGPIGGTMTVSAGGGWASVTYSTQLVSTPFTVPVRVPLAVETATNATNIAGQLVSDLAQYSPSPPITNAYYLGASNATSLPIYFGKSNAFLLFRNIEAGLNMTISNTSTSVVLNTTFPSRGITNLNGLTNLSQWFTVQATGTDLTITISTNEGVNGTNFFNLPLASSSSTGKLSKTDWTTFNLKQPPSTILTNLSATGAHTNAAMLIYRGPTNSGIGAPLILTAGTGITLATNNGTNFTISAAGAIPLFSNKVTRWFIANGSTNLAAIGDLISTQTVSTAILATNGGGNLDNGPAVQFPTTPSTNGFAGQQLYIKYWNPLLTCHTMTEAAGNDLKQWIGFTTGDFNNMISNNPVSLNVAAFRAWDTNANYFAYTSNGSTSEMNDTGVAIDSEWHKFQVKMNSSGTTVFYIDGVARRTNSSVSPNNIAMRAMLVRDNTALPTQVMRVEWLTVESDR